MQGVQYARSPCANSVRKRIHVHSRVCCVQRLVATRWHSPPRSECRLSFSLPPTVGHHHHTLTNTHPHSQPLTLNQLTHIELLFAWNPFSTSAFKVLVLYRSLSFFFVPSCSFSLFVIFSHSWSFTLTLFLFNSYSFSLYFALCCPSLVP